jgi:hypothetical protein
MISITRLKKDGIDGGDVDMRSMLEGQVYEAQLEKRLTYIPRTSQFPTGLFEGSPPSCRAATGDWVFCSAGAAQTSAVDTRPKRGMTEEMYIVR